MCISTFHPAIVLKLSFSRTVFFVSALVRAATTSECDPRCGSFRPPKRTFFFFWGSCFICVSVVYKLFAQSYNEVWNSTRPRLQHLGEFWLTFKRLCQTGSRVEKWKQIWRCRQTVLICFSLHLNRRALNTHTNCQITVRCVAFCERWRRSKLMADKRRNRALRAGLSRMWTSFPVVSWHKNLFLLLILSLDVEIKPLPHNLRFPCGACTKAVRGKDYGIACDSCNVWDHTICMNKCNQVYFAQANISWTCFARGEINFSGELFVGVPVKQHISVDDLSKASSSLLQHNPASPAYSQCY